MFSTASYSRRIGEVEETWTVSSDLAAIHVMLKAIVDIVPDFSADVEEVRDGDDKE